VASRKDRDSPGELVAVPDPEVHWLTQGCLDSLGVPDLLEQNALGVVLGIAREDDIVLVDDCVRGLDDCRRLVPASHAFHA